MKRFYDLTEKQQQTVFKSRTNSIIEEWKCNFVCVGHTIEERLFLHCYLIENMEELLASQLDNIHIAAHQQLLNELFLENRDGSVL